MITINSFIFKIALLIFTSYTDILTLVHFIKNITDCPDDTYFQYQDTGVASFSDLRFRSFEIIYFGYFGLLWIVGLYYILTHGKHLPEYVANTTIVLLIPIFRTVMQWLLLFGGVIPFWKHIATWHWIFQVFILAGSSFEVNSYIKIGWKDGCLNNSKYLSKTEKILVILKLILAG